MSNKKYVVLPAAEITSTITGKLKNYYQNLDYLFIQDTVNTIRHLIRKDNGQDYVLLSVSQGTPNARVIEILPNHGQGNDKYRRIYNDNPAFRDFLNDSFEA